MVPVPVATVVAPASVVVPFTPKSLSVVAYVPFSVALSSYCWKPLVVTDLRLTVPDVLVERLTSGLLPPTAALKSVAAVELATIA